MDPNPRGPEEQDDSAPTRAIPLTAGEYLVTVNPVDGSEVEPCPPGRRPAAPRRCTAEERAERERTAVPPPPPASEDAVPEPPLLERGEERDRLVRLLMRGRSVRLTGPRGAGRSALLAAVATDCADLAPHGVLRLSGCHRTAGDLLHELYAAVHDAPRHRPGRAELRAALRDIGAVVVLDDVEFGGASLNELLDATPECAFLVSAVPEVAAPDEDASLEEVFLPGLEPPACRRLLEHAARRPLTEEEDRWAADLWSHSQGLPLRFVQAGALLRQRDARHGGLPLPPPADCAPPVRLLAEGLSRTAREVLRYAVALGGELPHPAHLPAIMEDAGADAAVGDLVAGGLATPAGSRHRLAAGVAGALADAGYGEGAGDRALTVARHYTWWAGRPSVAPERMARDAEAVVAAVQGARRGGYASAAVLLARTAAPLFAASLHWSAWERILRGGQEAARVAGQVAEEAYFHHELGVFALCTDNLDRARAELEASIGLRGALADRSGAVAGRRALALVEDRSKLRESTADTAGGTARSSSGGLPTALGGATGLLAGGAGAAAGEGAGGKTAPGGDEEAPTLPNLPPVFGKGAPAGAAGQEESALPHGGGDDTADTVETEALTRRLLPGDRSAPYGGGPGPYDGAFEPHAGPYGETGDGSYDPYGGDSDRDGVRRLAAVGTRRNMLAAGAGALLAVVVGTVITLGAASSDTPSDGGPTGGSTVPADDKLPVDGPPQGTGGPAEAPEPSGTPEASEEADVPTPAEEAHPSHHHDVPDPQEEAPEATTAPTGGTEPTGGGLESEPPSPSGSGTGEGGQDGGPSSESDSPPPEGTTSSPSSSPSQTGQDTPGESAASDAQTGGDTAAEG